MAKYVVRMSFVSDVEIDAKDAETARQKAYTILAGNSVYSDDEVKRLHDEAYVAGGIGDDPPLRGIDVYSQRNLDFSTGDIEVREVLS